MRDYQRASDWDYIVSEDGGNTWSEVVRGYGAVDDIVRWIDRNRVYGVDRGGTIYYSNSGGQIFDSIHVDTDYIAGRSGIAAADAEFLYIAGESGRLARWRMTGSPSSGVEDGSPVVATATLLGNPVVDGRAVIRCAFATSGAVRIDLYDIRGALLRSSVGDVDAGVNDLSVDLGAFPSGRYLVRLIGEGVSAEVPVMLTN
jgi:hypothetical protein